MGQFSWFTQDTHHQIVDNNGNKYHEHQCEGYGVFNGKDYYEPIAEMNGLGSDRLAGISLAFKDSGIVASPKCLNPSLSVSGRYFDGRPPQHDYDQGFEETL